MTEFITTFDNFENYGDNYGDVYAPDFTLKRRPNSHTMRKIAQHSSQEYAVGVIRPGCSEGVYVTEMDEYLDYNHSSTIVLHKKDKFDSFIFEIEENCVEKTQTFDKRTNMNKTKYKVPVIGVLVDTSRPLQHKTFRGGNGVDAVQKDLEKFIMIRGKLYQINNYFRENGLEYSELQLPQNYFSNTLCEDGETSYCPQKTSFSKDILTYSFHHDMKISSIILRPELMKFKKISSDNRMSRYDRANPAILRKKQYNINVLENDPGILHKFELSYRSEQTNGQWVKYGVFNGNVSNIDFTKISFDEIWAKEIRIVPLSFHKSCECVRLTFIGKCKAQPKSDELFVTYEVCVPRDGKYLKYDSKNCDSNVNHGYFSSESREWQKEMLQKKKRYDQQELRQKVFYEAKY